MMIHINNEQKKIYRECTIMDGSIVEQQQQQQKRDLLIYGKNVSLKNIEYY